MCWRREEVQESQGQRVPRSRGPKDQDISNSHSNTSLTLKKVHLVKEFVQILQLIIKNAAHFACGFWWIIYILPSLAMALPHTTSWQFTKMFVQKRSLSILLVLCVLFFTLTEAKRQEDHDPLHLDHLHQVQDSDHHLQDLEIALQLHLQEEVINIQQV